MFDPVAYRMAWVFTSLGGSTTAAWVEDDPAIPRSRWRPRIGVNRPTVDEVKVWAAEQGLPWDPSVVVQTPDLPS